MVTVSVVTLIVFYLNIFFANQAQALPIGGRIVNGGNVGTPVIENDGQTRYVADGEYPYVVGLFDNGLFICGGAIIHKKVVITAAHCIYNRIASNLTILAGAMYTGETRGLAQIQKVSNLWYHPNFQHYGRLHYEHDVGLLFLKKPLVFNKYVNKINIEYQEMTTYDGETFTALGFGQGENNTYDGDNLKKANLTVLTFDECRKRVKPYRHPRYMICAADKNERQGICSGDSGGPFVRHYRGHPERDALVGITSLGSKYCDPKNVFGFTSLYGVKSFIEIEFYNNYITT